MQLVASFDPSVGVSGTVTIAQSSGAGKLVFYNESNVSLILSFQNGGSAYLPAWTACIYCGNFGGQKIGYKQQSVIVSIVNPISLVIIEAYHSDECILNIFPATLVRQTNVGNSIKTAQVGVSTLVNDGNAAATQFIEATVLGDSASAVSLTNDATFILGTAAHPGSVSFDNALINSNGAGTLSAAHISNTTPIDSLGSLPGAAGITTRFGQGLHGTTDVGFESATFAVMAGEQGALFKQNNFFDGTNHRFMTAAPAYQFDLGGAVSFFVGAIAVRSSTNATPVANAVITWTPWANIALQVAIGAAVQTVTTGSTLNVSATNTGNQITSTGTVTGIKMPMGTFSGQTVIFFNQGTFSMTFADHSTSNVINGTSVSIAPFKTQILIWNPLDGNQWFPV